MFSPLPPITETDSPQPQWVQHSGVIVPVNNLSADAQVCPCGLLSYCHVNRRSKVLYCTNATCIQTTITKGRTVYQCRDDSCFQRICSNCHAARPKLDKNLWHSLKETFTPVPKTHADYTKDRFGSSFSSHAQRLPNLVSPPDHHQSLSTTIKNLTSKGFDQKTFSPEFKEKDSHLLTQLGRLPQVITVPVLDWAPFGLSQRFATLYASALWNSVKTFDTNNSSLQKLHALLLLYLPALILHDSRRKDDNRPDAPSHRSIINLRLRQAEAGIWLPLVDDLLQAHIEFHQLSSPKTPTWKTKCARAAHKSLSCSWSLAFRALQEDSCPPPSQDTFDKVALKSICAEVSAEEHAILATAATKAKRTCNKHLAQKITHRAVAHRIRQLRLSSHPGCTKARNTHIAALLKTPYGVQAARLWVLAWSQGNVPQHVANLWLVGQVKALSKKSGSGVRPITLFEMLLKLATGVILDVSKADVIQAVGPYQYGALMECGADRMVYNLRSLALGAPHKLFIATDIQNAFGTVNRAKAVGALTKFLPAFVPIMFFS